MSRNALNLILDLASALTLLALTVTGLILRFVLLPGSGPRSLWTLRRHDWGGVHFWLAVSLFALLVAHVALHWQWVCNTLRRLVPAGRSEGVHSSRMARGLAGVAVLIVLAAGLTAFVWTARLSVQQVPRGSGRTVREPPGSTTQPDRGNRSRDLKAVSIRGSMTLAQAAASNNVSLPALCRQLGLPQDVNPDERLDRLGRQYGFSVGQVRRIVAELKQKPQ